MVGSWRENFRCHRYSITRTRKGVEKVITFVPGEGNKPLGIFMEKDSDSYHFQLFTVVKLELIIKAEQTCPSQYKVWVGTKKSREESSTISSECLSQIKKVTN